MAVLKHRRWRNNSLQPTATPLRGLSTAELKRWAPGVAVR